MIRCFPIRPHETDVQAQALFPTPHPVSIPYHMLSYLRIEGGGGYLLGAAFEWEKVPVVQAHVTILHTFKFDLLY